MTAVSRYVLPVLLAVSLVSVVLAPTAAAHEGVEVGEFVLRVGFDSEPAYVDVPNGVFLRVQHPKEGEGHHDANATLEPFLGAEKTLNVTVSTGGKEVTLPFEAKFGRPGEYVARFIPTVPGSYTFHFEGRLHDEPVDKKLEYPDPVEKRADAEFPARGASNYEAEQRLVQLTGEVNALKSEVASLKNQSKDGDRTVPGAGAAAVAGTIGVVAVLAAARRRG